MIKKSDTSTDDVLVLNASDEITSEDYTEVLIPNMQKLIDSKGGIRTVIIFDDTFTSFTFGAMVEDGLFGMKNISDFKKVSVVGLHNWMEEMIKAAEFIAPNIVKRFEPSQVDEALAWAKS